MLSRFETEDVIAIDNVALTMGAHVIERSS